MKIIDLLVKMANKKEVPLRIKYEGKIYKYYAYACGYYEEDCVIGLDRQFLAYNKKHLVDTLNDEVEVIEDKSEKIDKIEIETDEKCNNYYIRDKFSTKCYLTKHSKIIIDKVNEIIDKLNELLEESD